MKRNEELLKKLRSGKLVIDTEGSSPELSLFLTGKLAIDRYLFYINNKSYQSPFIPLPEMEDVKIVKAIDFMINENIGDIYEFAEDTEPVTWVKGKLMAILDHEFRYIINFNGRPTAFRHIRECKEEEIKAWLVINNKDSRTIFYTKEAAQHYAKQFYGKEIIELKGTRKK